ncbi:hypothetical protein F5Y18DRAFT_425475 [Xylariaceae sp. FL1019]|nr:hypothetical protein F5Y18DRAFT_425475 [Xylariaceae sp. FL1019]
MKINNILATILSSASLTLAWDVQKNYCDYFKLDLCLKSFRWCDTRHGGCSLPEGAYPDKPASTKDIIPLLDPDLNYTLEWQTSQPDVPVTVQWLLGASGMGLSWETNVTGKTELVFSPSEILNSFPTPAFPNTTYSEAWHASNWESYIGIYQAGQESDGSQPFYIGQGQFKKILDQQRENQYNRWKKGVGLGVGLGVPVLLLITALATWFTTKRKMSKSEPKQIEMTPQ